MNIEQMISYIFWGIFLSINIWIIYNDYIFRKIPNIGVLGLLVLGSVGIIIGCIQISAIGIISFFITLLVGFILFYYGFWSAGDAKYLVALSIFSSSESIVVTVGNIGIITMVYLLSYCFYIYIIQSLVSKGHGKSLISKIYLDIYSKIKIELIGKNKNGFKGLLQRFLPIIVGFLLVFALIRLVRIYLIEAYVSSQGGGNTGLGGYILELIQEYGYYVVIGIVISIYLVYRVLNKYVSKLYWYLCSKTGISKENGKIMGLTLLALLLVSFIVKEYIRDAEKIQESLIAIFTIYIVVWILIKIGLYIHYVTFQLGEIIYKPVKMIKPGDIVDTKFLIKIFGEQKSLGHDNKEGRYYPSPEKYFEQIENPIDNTTTFEIKNAYKTVNLFHKKNKTPHYEKMEAIKVYKVFAFGPYLFIGTGITLIYGDAWFRFISEKIITFITGI